jgi:hypothetical protein
VQKRHFIFRQPFTKSQSVVSMNQAIQFDTAEPCWAIARFIRVKLVLADDWPAVGPDFCEKDFWWRGD